MQPSEMAQLNIHVRVHDLQDTNVISESQISLEDFTILKVIGRGSYAKVLMVELKASKEIYAMKVIKKSLVMDEEVSILAMVGNGHSCWNSFSYCRTVFVRSCITP